MPRQDERRATPPATAAADLGFNCLIIAIVGGVALVALLSLGWVLMRLDPSAAPKVAAGSLAVLFLASGLILRRIPRR